MQKSFQRRLEELSHGVDHLIKKRCGISSACICFPESEQPRFFHEKEQEIASRLKCPIHGERFYRLQQFWVYQPLWLRTSRYLNHFSLSEQYQRAWTATFPYWPTKEEDEEAVYLRFANGAKYLAQRKADPFTHIDWHKHKIEGPDDLPPEVRNDIS